jgi:hypothetical protein
MQVGEGASPYSHIHVRPCRHQPLDTVTSQPTETEGAPLGAKREGKRERELP